MLQGFSQIVFTLILMITIVPFLGKYMARVFLHEKTLLDPVVDPVEKILFQVCGIRSDISMTAWGYIRSLFYSNFWMGFTVFVILMLQSILPLNPTGLATPSWHLALHTTLSFLANTDQQHYSGETTLTYFSQTTALGFLMFTSAATGLSVGVAFIRGLTGRPLGNFYQDLIQSVTRILLPFSIVGGILLLIFGVPETLSGPAIVTTLEGYTQVIARGPVASFEIIKQLGENGGGFFGANSAHPFENPNPVTNLIEILAMLAIPSSLIITYGIFANSIKQAWLLFILVLMLFCGGIVLSGIQELSGNPQVNALFNQSYPNLEGKEVRFGWEQTILWAMATTATMCGAVNGMHDSLMPLSGFSTLLNMFLQMVWGGQGTGTAYLFIYSILTVFLTGLMVGRTPEFLGRKIEKREIVLASVILLVHPFAILLPTAITLLNFSLTGISNPGFHGLSQVVYEYTSAAANNGSGFEGLADNTLWWNLSTAGVIFIGRYLPLLALILLADGILQKQPVPETSGTLRTDTVLFTGVTGGVILILGLLTFLPVLVLGPVAESFSLAP